MGSQAARALARLSVLLLLAQLSPATGRALVRTTPAAAAAPWGRSLQQQQQGQAALADVTVSFVSCGPDAPLLRLPPPPRTFALRALRQSTGEAVATVAGLPYAQNVTARVTLPDGESVTLELRDEASPSLLLYSSAPGGITASSSKGPTAVAAAVHLQPLLLQARFTRVSWAGGSRYYAPSEAAEADVSVLGAEISVWTHGNSNGSSNSSSKGSSNALWATRYTGDNGAALFFLPPSPPGAFFVNFSLGDTLLASHPVGAVEWRGDRKDAAWVRAPTQVVTTDRKLLCTGDIEPVFAIRGQQGSSFPPNNAGGAYVPQGMVCRWAIVPPSPGALLTLEVDYSTLLPGEAVIIHGESGASTILSPGCCDRSGLFRTSILAATPVRVDFLTSERLDRRVGGFRVDWASQEETRGPQSPSLRGREVVIIVVAAACATVLALAICAFCARRQQGALATTRPAGGRAGAAAAAAAAQQQLRNCPSPVRRLLPVRPYVPPEKAPWLGAAEGEVDCCSICLTEFDPGERLTVLPCAHFYHIDCLDGWLQRNCTCPLCKSDVLDAMESLMTAAAATGATACTPADADSAGATTTAPPAGDEENGSQGEVATATVVVTALPRAAATPLPLSVVAGSPPPQQSGHRPAPLAIPGGTPGTMAGVGPLSARSGLSLSRWPSGGSPLPLSAITPGAASLQAGRTDALVDDFIPAAAAAAAVLASPRPQRGMGAWARRWLGGGRAAAGRQSAVAQPPPPVETPTRNLPPSAAQAHGAAGGLPPRPPPQRARGASPIPLRPFGSGALSLPSPPASPPFRG